MRHVNYYVPNNLISYIRVQFLCRNCLSYARPPIFWNNNFVLEDEVSEAAAGLGGALKKLEQDCILGVGDKDRRFRGNCMDVCP